jgi:hypothetical protein
VDIHVDIPVDIARAFLDIPADGGEGLLDIPLANVQPGHIHPQTPGAGSRPPLLAPGLPLEG